MEELYQNLAEILEVDELYAEDHFRDFDAWDSLAALSILSMVDESYGLLLPADQLAGMQTIGQLEEWIKEKKGL